LSIFDSLPKELSERTVLAVQVTRYAINDAQKGSTLTTLSPNHELNDDISGCEVIKFSLVDYEMFERVKALSEQMQKLDCLVKIKFVIAQGGQMKGKLIVKDFELAKSVKPAPAPPAPQPVPAGIPK